ncbi:hypothetical protein AAG570_011425 [Ranatra chinensis]|uniref:Uncharacterized protein n=1 Tax=Ranatra chinensis TaxID=642074 RepID=A0ABD0Z6U5_9HEMI
MTDVSGRPSQVDDGKMNPSDGNFIGGKNVSDNTASNRTCYNRTTELYCDYPQSLKLKTAFKRRNMFYENKKQETTEIGTCNLPSFCDGIMKLSERRSHDDFTVDSVTAMSDIKNREKKNEERSHSRRMSSTDYQGNRRPSSRETGRMQKRTSLLPPASKFTAARRRRVTTVNIPVSGFKHTPRCGVHCAFYLATRVVSAQTGTLLLSLENGHVQLWTHHSVGGLIAKFYAVHTVADYVISMNSDQKNEYLFTGKQSRRWQIARTDFRRLLLLVLVEHVSALGRRLQPERLWVIAVQLREREFYKNKKQETTDIVVL